MNAFEVTVLGVGDTFSERHAPSSLLLRAEGFQVAIDCPDMYRRVLHEASRRGAGPLDVSRIDDVLLTHVHGDHMNGLEGLGFYKRFQEGKRIRLHAPSELLESLWEQRLRISMGQLWDGERLREMSFGDYFEGCPLAWEGVNPVGPFEVELRRTRHHVPTNALRVGNRGRRLGYSSDTAFDPGLLDWLSEADLIIHETNLGPAHTPVADLAALPDPLRHRMRLIHYPDALDLRAVPIRALREGERIKV